MLDDAAVAHVMKLCALTSWRKCHAQESSIMEIFPAAPETTEAGAEYQRVREAHYKATADLWMATDIEYDNDGFRDRVWYWRYWKVQARKCCWYHN